MRKKTTWAASVVRKQLQTCCQHETLSLETHERDDDLSVESVELASQELCISSPVRDASPLPALLRRKSFTASHVKNLLTTPEPPTPYRKSVDSSLPLCAGATFKPRRLQYVRSTAALVPTPAPTPPKPKVHPKSGPLPTLVPEIGCDASVKRYLSGPLQRKARSPSPDRTIKLISMSGKAKELPTNRLMRVRSSAQALFPTVATSKLPGMVTQGTLKKAAQLAKVTPVLDRRGSSGRRSDERRSDERRSGVGERERVRAAVRIQAAVRGYRERKRYAVARAGDVSGELSEGAASVSTRMSRTGPGPGPAKRKPVVVRGAREQQVVSKSWNGSLRTAQDCQAMLKSRQEAALKRERAMEYAMSRQHWKAGSRSQKSATPASWVVDNTFPDKPGWVWTWLERLGAHHHHHSPNRIFDHDPEDAPDTPPVSESLSIKSTVGVCTTELATSAGEHQPPHPMTYPWPLSLRQQHAAGLLHPRPLKTSGAHRQQRSRELRELCRSREELSSSCVSDALELTKPRKLEFEDGLVMQEGGDGESVGSCVGPLQCRLSSPFVGPRARTSSQSGVQQQQVRMSNANSVREPVKVNFQAHANSQSHHKPRHQVSVALSEDDDDDDDSAGTTAASVRRPFWRP